MTGLLLTAGATASGTITNVDGVRLLLSDGREAVDLSGIGHVLSIGHGLGELRDRIIADVSASLIPGSGRIARFESSERLAATVAEQWGDPYARSYFAPSGTDAVELAIQLALHIQTARGRSDRTTVLGMHDSYHGMSVAATSVAGHRSHRARLARVLIPWPKLPSFSEPTDVWNSAEIEDLFRSAAAVVFEPVGGTTSGALAPPDGILAMVTELAKRHGCLVIVDEVVTGFGRTGTEFVTAPGTADILVSGKWLGGGYVALCAVMLSSPLATEVNDQELPLRFTFANMSVACAVAGAVQDVVAERRLVSGAHRTGIALRTQISQEVSRRGLDAEVRGVGMLLAVEISVDNVETRMARLRSNAQKRNVVAMLGSRTTPSGAGKVHVMCTPPLDINDSEIDTIAATIVDLVND